MGVISSAYDSFFERAGANGRLVDAEAPRDSRLVEYSVDQHLADTRRLDDSFFALLRGG